MLHLIKYEYRRNLSGIVAMLGSIILLQGFFLYAVLRKDVELVIPASTLLFFAAMLCVLGMLLYSVALYSKELNAKTSYLTFMTPNSATKILGSKLLAALLLGLFLALLLAGTAAWDFTLLRRTFPQIDLGGIMLEQVLKNMSSIDLQTVLTVIAAMALDFLINFFTVVTIAYLAITLSATVLQNKKFKGFLSFLIFVGLMAALQWGAAQLPGTVIQPGHSFPDVVLGAWPRYVAYLGAMVGSFALSAWLLEKKVSL
ncbi:hypothetical protein ACH6CV_12650 [Bacillota bacterium Meth-B3]|nr:hypothetical protein [Christensenellaceae bacterium]MEA5064545.1 hypothetical protein [Eubacteriales bacterium]MEA5067390.1 hypothetical protein [Christensenellaceae bacterium]